MPFKSNPSESQLAVVTEPEVEIDTEILTKRIFKEVGKPSNFVRLEIKPIGQNRYRINMICKSKTDKEGFFQDLSRPWSWYASFDSKSNIWKFSPELRSLE